MLFYKELDPEKVLDETEIERKNLKEYNTLVFYITFLESYFIIITILLIAYLLTNFLVPFL